MGQTEAGREWMDRMREGGEGRDRYRENGREERGGDEETFLTVTLQ